MIASMTYDLIGEVVEDCEVTTDIAESISSVEVRTLTHSQALLGVHKRTPETFAKP